MYIFGVFLYWCGYVAFTALYAGNDAASPGLYNAGSWLFLTGSALLMIATYPTAFAGIRNAIFWGSASFFLGSTLFVLDASGSGFVVPGVNVKVGLVAFVVGRVLFIIGSQTKRCSIFFRVKET